MSGSAPVALLSGQTEPFGLAVDGTFVYVTSAIEGTLTRAPK